MRGRRRCDRTAARQAPPATATTTAPTHHEVAGDGEYLGVHGEGAPGAQLHQQHPEVGAAEVEGEEGALLSARGQLAHVRGVALHRGAALGGLVYSLLLLSTWDRWSRPLAIPVRSLISSTCMWSLLTMRSLDSYSSPRKSTMLTGSIVPTVTKNILTCRDLPPASAAR